MSLVARRRTEIVAAAEVGHRCATCGVHSGGGGLTCGPTCQESRPAAEKPAAAVPGGPVEGRVMLFVDPVGAHAAVGFEALDGIASFFIAPAMNPRTVWRNQPMVFMISSMVAPFFRWSMATTCAVFEPSRGVAATWAPFLPLEALAGVAFLVALPFAGAGLADCAPPLAFFAAFGLVGAGSGCAASPKPWMRSQMRATAVFGSLSFFAGYWPGKLFRIANRRSAGQAAANSASSCFAGEAVEGCGGGGRSLLRGRKRHDFVRFVAGKSRHTRSPRPRSARLMNIHHSEALGSKAPFEINLQRRRIGDGARRLRQIAPGCAK